MSRIDQVRLLATSGIARSSGGLMGATIVNGALGYVFWAVAARFLNPSQVGIANALISASVLAAIVGDLGLRTFVIQVLPSTRDIRAWSAQVSDTLLLAVISGTVSSVVVWNLMRWLSPAVLHELGGGWPAVFALLTVATVLFNILDGLQTVERAPRALLRRNILTASIKVVILAVLVGAGIRSAHGIVIATATAIFIGVAMTIVFSFRRSKPGWRFRPGALGPFIRRCAKSLAGHHLINIGAQLPVYVLPLEVVARLSAKENGYSAITWMLGSIFFMVSPAVSSALFTEGRWDQANLRASTRRAALLIGALLLPAGLFMIVFGKLILGIFGADYARAGYLMLVLLVVSAVPDAITNVRIAVYRAELRLRRAATLNLGMAVVAMGSAWALLPRVGIAAAGLAWLIAQGAGALWVLFDRPGGEPATVGRHALPSGTDRRRLPSPSTEHRAMRHPLPYPHDDHERAAP